ncbi:hypothetical protein SO694_00004057 [Aureococcus anophagefferens]|uniref:Uncharacterized protein n=1 Tax=Aureococcus anophagefferens TaxID=44056 RepID=A0ABR1G8G7_AURAN
MEVLSPLEAGGGYDMSGEPPPASARSVASSSMSVDVGALLGDADESLDKLSVLLDVDGAVRTKAQKRVNRMFQKSSQQLGDLLELALEAQRQRADFELTTAKIELTTEFKSLLAALEHKMQSQIDAQNEAMATLQYNLLGIEEDAKTRADQLAREAAERERNARDAAEAAAAAERARMEAQRLEAARALEEARRAAEAALKSAEQAGRDAKNSSADDAAERDRLARELAERERLERERLERERLAQLERDRLAALERERLAGLADAEAEAEAKRREAARLAALDKERRAADAAASAAKDAEAAREAAALLEKDRAPRTPPRPRRRIWTGRIGRAARVGPRSGARAHVDLEVAKAELEALQEKLEELDEFGDEDLEKSPRSGALAKFRGADGRDAGEFEETLRETLDGYEVSGLGKRTEDWGFCVLRCDFAGGALGLVSEFHGRSPAVLYGSLHREDTGGTLSVAPLLGHVAAALAKEATIPSPAIPAGAVLVRNVGSPTALSVLEEVAKQAAGAAPAAVRWAAAATTRLALVVFDDPLRVGLRGGLDNTRDQSAAGDDAPVLRCEKLYRKDKPVPPDHVPTEEEKAAARATPAEAQGLPHGPAAAGAAAAAAALEERIEKNEKAIRGLPAPRDAAAAFAEDDDGFRMSDELRGLLEKSKEATADAEAREKLAALDEYARGLRRARGTRRSGSDGYAATRKSTPRSTRAASRPSRPRGATTPTSSGTTRARRRRPRRRGRRGGRGRARASTPPLARAREHEGPAGRGSGALEGRLREVEATAGDLDKKLRSVSGRAAAHRGAETGGSAEIWDFVQAHLQRSGWYEERLSRIASAVDEKPSESQVRAMMRQLDAIHGSTAATGARRAVLVERIHGELTRKVGRRDVIRLINVAVEGAEGAWRARPRAGPRRGRRRWAVMGLSLDSIAGLAAPPAALGEPGGPLLHPLHVKQRGRPSFPANQPDLKPAPTARAHAKQASATPPNQLILASYPNGRPGALRALQRAPSAAQVPDDYGAAEDVIARVAVAEDDARA